MHASTARACLRKLSDWVNSVSKHQASERVIPRFSPVSPGFFFAAGSWLRNLHSFPEFHHTMLLTLADKCRTVRLSLLCLLWHSRNLNGYDSRSGRLPGCGEMRPMP